LGIPIHQTATFRYPELEDGSKAPYIYSRYTNPTVEVVEAKIAGLDGAAGTMLFSTGMAAIATLCQAVLKPGDTVAVQRGVYGGTRAYMDNDLAPWGVKIHTLDAHAPPTSLPAGTRLVWMESITNPLLRVADVTAWAAAADKAGALLCVDATFASPIVQQPLELGADLVMQSGTKYLGGHSDLLAGCLSWKASVDPAPMQRLRRNTGPSLDAHAAFLLGRGIKTLDVRVRRHVDNALTLAKACQTMPGVKVHYPGLPSHPDHAVAKRLLRGFGGVVTIDVGSLSRAQSFRRKLRTIVPAASLGGVESLASLPLETSHQYASAESRRADGVTDGLVRISVGIEDVEDLIADVVQALG
jgi:cystathionine beta-lyase/cystathionine gamma-synthase